MLFKKLLNILFPYKCIACSSFDADTHICANCWNKISFITKPYCKICSFPFEYEESVDSICGNCVKKTPKYEKLFSVMKYDEYSNKIIHRFKYQDHLEITQYLCDLMMLASKEVIKEIDYITAVPIHRLKLLKRGYNQASLLASLIARKSNKKYLPDLIKRIKNNKAQAGLSKNERQKNIKNVFKLNNKYINILEHKKILLIDDVVTTGATLEECCLVLKQINYVKIYILTIAKRI